MVSLGVSFSQASLSKLTRVEGRLTFGGRGNRLTSAVGGNLSTTVGGNLSTTVGGNLSTTVGGYISTTVGGGIGERLSAVLSILRARVINDVRGESNRSTNLVRIVGLRFWRAPLSRLRPRTAREVGVLGFGINFETTVFGSE